MQDHFLNGSAFWRRVPSPEELPKQFQKMSERFTEILDIQDDEEFVKRCADFHFDFLQMHPYTDGNGRTARTLLSLMLASHNILMPSLYD